MIRKLSVFILGSLLVYFSCKEFEGPSITTLSTPPVGSPTQLPSPAPNKPVQAQQIEKTWESNFDFGARSIQKQHNGIRSYKITVEYPQINRTRTRPTLRFNRWMRKKIVGYVRQFERLEQNAEVRDRRRGLPPVDITEGLGIWFKVYYSDNRLISLRLTHSVMALGQMHPIDYYETINYDLRRGAPLRDYDVFKRGYLKVFSDYTRQHVRENYQMDYTTDDWLRRGTKPRRDHFTNWNITPEGILISFEDYQIGSHAFGQLELIIPFAKLASVLRKDAPAPRFPPGITKRT